MNKIFRLINFPMLGMVFCILVLIKCNSGSTENTVVTTDTSQVDKKMSTNVATQEDTSLHTTDTAALHKTY